MAGVYEYLAVYSNTRSGNPIEQDPLHDCISPVNRGGNSQENRRLIELRLKATRNVRLPVDTTADHAEAQEDFVTSRTRQPAN